MATKTKTNSILRVMGLTVVKDWDRKTKEHVTMPYPDDLDDTFAALAALQQYDPRIIGGEGFDVNGIVTTYFLPFPCGRQFRIGDCGRQAL